MTRREHRRLAFAAWALLLGLSCGGLSCGDHHADVIRLGGGRPPSVAGCPVLPADSPWNRDISGDRVDPRSAEYIASIGTDAVLDPHFGSSPATGIPYTVVPGTQPRATITFSYADESDPGPYPIPPDIVVEGGPGATGGDRHALIIDRDACLLYEILELDSAGVDAWRGRSGAIWNLRENRSRPPYWTSANGAGLPTFPGLVRYDELSSGEIRHALRFRAPVTQRAFAAPASHFASDQTDPALPPMGLRVRLKASIDVRNFPMSVRVILRALQRYGMFLSDHGQPWAITGAPDARLNDREFEMLRGIRGADFEAIETGPLTR